LLLLKVSNLLKVKIRKPKVMVEDNNEILFANDTATENYQKGKFNVGLLHLTHIHKYLDLADTAQINKDFLSWGEYLLIIHKNTAPVFTSKEKQEFKQMIERLRYLIPRETIKINNIYNNSKAGKQVSYLPNKEMVELLYDLDNELRQAMHDHDLLIPRKGLASMGAIHEELSDE